MRICGLPIYIVVSLVLSMMHEYSKDQNCIMQQMEIMVYYSLVILFYYGTQHIHLCHGLCHLFKIMVILHHNRDNSILYIHPQECLLKKQLKGRFRRIKFFTEYREMSFITNTVIAACILIYNY